MTPAFTHLALTARAPIAAEVAEMGAPCALAARSPVVAAGVPRDHNKQPKPEAIRA